MAWNGAWAGRWALSAAPPAERGARKQTTALRCCLDHRSCAWRTPPGSEEHDERVRAVGDRANCQPGGIGRSLCRAARGLRSVTADGDGRGARRARRDAAGRARHSLSSATPCAHGVSPTGGDAERRRDRETLAALLVLAALALAMVLLREVAYAPMALMQPRC